MGQNQVENLGDLVEFDEGDMRGEDSLYTLQRPETIVRRITYVLFEEIAQTSPTQTRELIFDPETNSKDRELLASVKEHGIITPIVVRDLSQRGSAENQGFNFQKRGERSFALVAGHRRVEAGKAAGLKGTEGVITKSSEDHELFTLAENMGHRELTSYEEALALKTLQDRRNLSGRQVAEVTGLSQTHINRLFNALKAPEVLKKLWREGDLDATSLVELKKQWPQFSSEVPAWLTLQICEMSRREIRDLRDQLGAGTPLKTALNAQGGLSSTASHSGHKKSLQEEQPGSPHPASHALTDVDESSGSPTRKEQRPHTQTSKTAAASIQEGLKRDVVTAITDVFPIKEEQGEALFDEAVNGEIKEEDVLWAAALYVAQGGEIDQAVSLAAEALSTRWMRSVMNREVKQMKRVARGLATCQHKELESFMLTIFSPLNSECT
jgi:ParB/RepB/Spo0J family partition protein